MLCLLWSFPSTRVVEIIDIETAFLYGDLEEEIFMELPEGLEHVEQDIDPENYVAKLTATLYGLVQASRQFWKKLMKALVTKLFFK